MSAKKRKPARRKPDLTMRADHFVDFTDKPRGGRTQTSPGVVKSFDPDVADLNERISRKPALRQKKKLSGNGAAIPDARRVESLVSLLEDCLRTSESISSKRITGVIQLLRDARRRVKAIQG